MKTEKLLWLTSSAYIFYDVIYLQKIQSNKTNATWVAITGATGAIGFDYACEFAKHGFNVLFIIRNADKANEKISN